jgi:single-strand DNA-binding protein
MLNQSIIVGRLTKDPEVVTTESGKKMTQVVVAVNRSFKNIDGKYETDFIRCVLWNGVAESTTEYCKKGDLVGIKGRLQSSSYEVDGNTKYSVDIIAEKVTFLSNKKTEESIN